MTDSSTAKRGRSEGSSGEDTPFLKKIIRDPSDVTLELPNDAPFWVPTLFRKIDELVDYVHDMTEKQEVFKAAVEQKIAQTNDKFETICNESRKEIAELKHSVEFISTSYDEQKKINDVLLERIENMEKHQNIIKKKCHEYEEELVTNANLIDSLEQYGRRNCVLIHGVPETKDENTDTLAIDTINEHLKIPLKARDLDRTHRIGKRKVDKTRPIIVKFARYNKRRSVFKNKKLFKGSAFMMTESLTVPRVKMLNAAKEKFGKDNVWSWDGEVFAKNGENIVNVKYL